MINLVNIALLILWLSSCSLVNHEFNYYDLPGHYYKIKTNDTLSMIAKKYRISVHEIIEVNGIDDAKNLRIGKLLFLPDSGNYIGHKIKTVTSNNPKKPIVSKPSNNKFLFPVNGGKIIHKFSRTSSNPYDGIGIKAPLGSRVIAAQEGQVLFCGNDGTKFGLLIIIEHSNSFITVYTHLNKSLVKEGQIVKAGQSIGLVGKSGGISVAQLHFQIRKNRRPQDPIRYIYR